MSSPLSALTTRGRAFVAAGVASGLSALAVGQKDLLRVALLLLLLPLLTVLLASRSRYLLTSARLLVPTRVQAGEPAQVELRLENPGRAPTGVMLLEDTIPYVLGSRPRFVIDQLRPKWHREMTYVVRSDVRGRYILGPLTVRLSDPFGFVELSRSFSARTALVVTPVIHALPVTTLSGDWSGTGDSRPRAFAAAGTEDITIREYRLGDDLRRVHWRSTAHTNELMVRREEQPHQNRVTVLLDTRASAHRGSGPSSSFEYAVAAAASVSSHLAGHGFVVRMLMESTASRDATWHDRGISAPAEVEMLLESLAVISLSNRADFEVASTDYSAAGLVIAILGETSPADVASLHGLKSGATRALAILLDVASWSRADHADARGSGAAADQATILRRQGWGVVVATPGDRLSTLWRDLAQSRSALSRSTLSTSLSNAGTPQEAYSGYGTEGPAA